MTPQEKWNRIKLKSEHIYNESKKLDKEIYDELVKDGTIKIDPKLEEFGKIMAKQTKQTIDNIIKESLGI